MLFNKILCSSKHNHMVKKYVVRTFVSSTSVSLSAPLALVSRFKEPKQTNGGKATVPKNKTESFCTQTFSRPPNQIQENITRHRSLYTPEESSEFMSVFSQLREDILSQKPWGDIPELRERAVRFFDYHTPDHRRIRGLFTVHAYKQFEKQENLTQENIKLATIVGWCATMLELTQSIADDIADKSKKRFGMTCWYLLEDIGNVVNDLMLLENGCFYLLQKHLSHHPQYMNLVDKTHEVHWKTIMGQYFDLSKINFDKFNMNYFNALSVGKNQYMNYYFPVALAMYLANIDDPKLHLCVRNVLLKIGQFFHIQNDYVNFCDNQHITGKTGEDIQGGRLTWLVVVALQRANSDQCKLLEQHYGKPERESVEVVCNLYRELKLSQAFEEYKEDILKDIEGSIQNLPPEMPQELFASFLEVYKCESNFLFVL